MVWWIRYWDFYTLDAILTRDFVPMLLAALIPHALRLHRSGVERSKVSGCSCSTLKIVCYSLVPESDPLMTLCCLWTHVVPTKPLATGCRPEGVSVTLPELPLSDPGVLLSLRLLTLEIHRELSGLGCTWRREVRRLLFQKSGDGGCRAESSTFRTMSRCFIHRAWTTSRLPHEASRSRALGDELVAWKPRHPLLWHGKYISRDHSW